MSKNYAIKEMFYSLQGEGAQAGRAAVFCRFTGCNLWSGLEKDRAASSCYFCDTDFVGVDGQNGGKFASAEAVVDAVASLWPNLSQGRPYVIFTGGEPLLQLDQALVDAAHARGFEVAVETNGTQPAPDGLDWICLSPKGPHPVVLTACDEIKLVYPQTAVAPEAFADFPAKHYFLSPIADPLARGTDPVRDQHAAQAVAYCLQHPQWRLTLQLHKLLDID